MTTSAIILCAGNGTRMKSKKAKVLHNVCGKPMCIHVIDHVLKIAQQVVVVVGGQPEVRDALFEAYGKKLTFAVQQEPKGTADAVITGLREVDNDANTILVAYGDTPLIQQSTMKTLCDMPTESVAFAHAQVANPHGYGRVVPHVNGEGWKIVEEKEATLEEKKVFNVNVGLYAFNASFLRRNIVEVDRYNNGREFYLTDLIEKARDAKTYEIVESEMIGINNRIQLSQAERSMRERIVQRLMMEGVSFEDPATTYIEPTVRLGTDVLIGAGVTLKGHCVIGNDVVIENGSVIQESILEDNVHIAHYSVLESAFVGNGSRVGPFAHLRPHSHLEENCKVGNFVEIKNVRFKKNSKANHLSYLGDAVIGESCNIGAGAITCNYDGYRKHKTLVGDNVFVGSNVTLIAPLTVGDNSYIGAGSTINEDVPASSLALARTRQVNKSGYAGKIKQKKTMMPE